MNGTLPAAWARNLVEGAGIERIQTEVAVAFGLSPEQLLGNRRKHVHQLARVIAQYLCRELTPWGNRTIGEAFGGRDASTVSFNVSRAKKLIATDAKLRRIVAQLRELLAPEPVQDLCGPADCADKCACANSQANSQAKTWSRCA